MKRDARSRAPREVRCTLDDFLALTEIATTTRTSFRFMPNTIRRLTGPLVVCLLLFVLAPPLARAQSAADAQDSVLQSAEQGAGQDGAGEEETEASSETDVSITVRVERGSRLARSSSGRAEERPRLVPPNELTLKRPGLSEEESALIAGLGGLALGLGAIGLAAVLHGTRRFGEEMPVWAVVSLGVSVELQTFGLLAIAGGLASLTGVDPSAALVGAGTLEVALGLMLASLLFAIAPDLAGPWADPVAQRHVTDIVASEAAAFAINGILGIAIGAAGGEDAGGVTVAPMIGGSTFGASAAGQF